MKKTAGLFSGRRALILLYCLTASFAVLLFCTRSSFLYPYNNWDDSNSYFTVGKCLFHGILPYRDIFDQKGPWLYLAYGICSLLSFRTFAGVFLMEIICGTVCALLYYRIFRLFLRPAASLFLIPPLLAVSFSSKSFYWGGCAEELCLPFLLLPLYLLLKGLSEGSDDVFTKREYFVCGLCAGFVACTKFTMLGFHFAVLFTAFLRVFFGRSDRSPLSRILVFFRSCALFLTGMFLPAVPWLLWFGFHGALQDWYRDYIYTNVFLYSSFGANSKGENLYDRIYNLAKLLYWLIIDNFRYFFFIISGCAFFLFRNWKKHHFRGILLNLVFPILFFFTFLGIFIGGSHLPYYSLPLTATASSGMIALGLLAEKSWKILPPKFSAPLSRAAVPLLIFFLVACSGLSGLTTMNRYYLSYRKEDVFLSRFAEDIRHGGISDPTLLNYGCLDCGLYTAAGVYPDCYWFQTQTLPTDEIVDDQKQYMREGRTDYVVVRGEIPECIYDRYELIDSFDQVMGEAEFSYYLFRRK